MTDTLYSELARRFRFNDGFLDVLVEGLEPSDWASALGEQGGNPPHWILGHVATSRRYLLRKLGVELPLEPWEHAFGMKSEPGDTAEYPAPDVLIADFKTSGEKVVKRLETMTAEQGEAEIDASFPDGSKTAGGAAGFLHFHETYHLGQLGLARRLLGRPGFA